MKTNTIQQVVDAVRRISPESASGLEKALDAIGGLNPALPEEVKRRALIDVVAPRVEAHPAACSKAYSDVHYTGDDYGEYFIAHVVPVICNLFLFQ